MLKNKHIGAAILGLASFFSAYFCLYNGFSWLSYRNWIIYFIPFSMVNSIYGTLSFIMMLIIGVMLFVCMITLFRLYSNVTRLYYDVTLVSSIIIIIGSTFTFFLNLYLSAQSGMNGITLILGITTILYLHIYLRIERPERSGSSKSWKESFAEIFSEPESTGIVVRPRGVTILAIGFLIIGVIVFITGVWLGVFLQIGSGQIESIKSTISFLSFYLTLPYSLPADTFLLYAYVVGYVNFQLNLVIWQMETVAVEILGMVYVFTAIGLFQMRRWGRYLALILGAIMLTGGLIGFLYIIGIIPFAFGLATVLYLKGDVKYCFE
ncbi:MAG: hypothetical protein QW279_14355 [Candidatus Jordarchaeaceae archaeon]